MTDWRRCAVSFVVALTAAVAGCGRPTGRIERPEQVTDFKTLYESNCAGCHGADGRRGVAQPLRDPTYLALVSDARLIEVISRGVRGTPMTAFAVDAGGMLTSEQVRALVDGMRRSWSGAPPPAGPESPAYSETDAIAHGSQAGDPSRGRTAYDTYCARCHGNDAGGGTAGSIVDESFLSLTSDQALRTTIIVGRNDENIPGWREYAPGQPMTSQQVSDVVAWLASHRGKP